MKILQLSPPVPKYGVGRYAEETSIVLRALGHRVMLVSLGSPGSHYPFHAYEDSLETVLNNLPLGERLIGAGPFDVIIAHGWETALAASALGRVSGSPLAAVMHGTEVGRREGKMTRIEAYVAEMERWSVSRSELVIAPSLHVRRELIELYGADADRIRVVPGGASTGRETDVDRKAFAAGDEKIALFVGRLAREKGADQLPELFHRIRKKNGWVRFLVAGDGPLRPVVESACAQKKLSERVRFLGHRTMEEIRGLYRISDALILPSRYEALGISAVEAATSGLPVVAFGVGGIDELKRSFPTIRSVTPGDLPAFATETLGALRNGNARSSDSVLPDSLLWDSAGRAMERCARSLLEREVA